MVYQLMGKPDPTITWDQTHTDPNKVEQDLMGQIPRDRWIGFSHQLIHHGRRVCNSRKPKCDACVLADVCPYGQQN